MLICPHCGQQLPDDNKFCINCGNPLQSQEQAPVQEPQPAQEQTPAQEPQPTQEQQPAQEQAPVQEPQPAQPYVYTQAAQPDQPAFSVGQNAYQYAPAANAGAAAKAKKSLPLGAVIGAAAAAVFIVIAVILISMITSNGGGVTDYTLYLKEGDLYFDDFSGEPIMLTSHISSGIVGSDDSLYSNKSILSSLCCLTKDGKTLFYPDIQSSGYSNTLFCRSVTDAGAAPKRIDSDIYTYAVNNDGSIAVYIKAGRLYRYDVRSEERTVLDGSADRIFYFSDDGGRVVYIDEGDALCENLGGEKQKIDSDVSEVYVCNDGKTVIYRREDMLYKKTDGSDKEKLASGICSLDKVYDTGEVYFSKRDIVETRWSDVVEDDMTEYDAALKEPVYPDYPSWSDYESDEEYNNACLKYDKEYEAYSRAYEEYNRKLNRDIIRERLDTETTSVSVYKLFYYDGKECAEISQINLGMIFAEDVPAVTFSRSGGEAAKLKLSEVDENYYNIYSFADLIEHIDSFSKETCLAVNKSVSVISDSVGATIPVISSDGKLMYYYTYTDSDDYNGSCDIYRVTISDGKPSAPEKYDTGVYSEVTYFVFDDGIAYFKNKEISVGQLYMNKQKIDDNVFIYMLPFDEDTDTLCYFSEYKEDRSCGTLKAYSDGKTVTVADDVYRFKCGKSILFIGDYSLDKRRGDLYIYRNGKKELLSDEVSCFIEVYEGNIKRVEY